MKRWMFRAGTVLGVRIDVHAALILFVLAVIFLGQGKLIAAELVVIFFHEMGHALAARALGMRVEGMELTPFGGIARIGGYMELTPKKEALVSIAGPAVNLMFILVILYVSTAVFPIYMPPETVLSFVRVFLSANIMIMVFNLLPALPMDAGRVARALLAPVFGLSRATKWCAVLGMIIGALLIGLGIFSIFYGAFNITLFTAGSYLFYAASREKRITPLVLLESTEKKRDTVQTDTMTVRHIATNGNINIGELLSRFSPQRYHIITVLDGQMREIGVITEQQIITAWLSEGPLVPLGKLL